VLTCLIWLHLLLLTLYQVTWFLYNKQEEGAFLDWDLNQPAVISNYVKGYWDFLWLTSPRRALLSGNDNNAAEADAEFTNNSD
jgi:hypothetical protein